jgi:hypothetical protein
MLPGGVLIYPDYAHDRKKEEHFLIKRGRGN